MAALATGHRAGDGAKHRLAEVAHGLRRQRELAVRAAPHRAGFAQGLLEPLQGAGVHHRVGPELARQLLEVEVVQLGALVGLRELLRQCVEVGEVLEDASAVAKPEPVLTVQSLRAAPVLDGSQGAQAVVQQAGRAHQLRRAERLLGERVELVALLARHGAAHPLRGRGTAGQGAQELVKGAGLLGEVVAVLRHEVVELLLAVLAALAGVEQAVEVGQHLAQGGPVGVARVLQRLLHAGEALVEHLTAQEVVELHLSQGTVALVHVDVARELPAFGQDCPVEELLDLLQRAVQVVRARQLAAPLGDTPRQLVQAGLVPAAAPQELAHRTLGRGARHHVLADRVQRLGEVDRRRERVWPVDVRGVPRPSSQPTIGPSHRSSRRRLTPC